MKKLLGILIIILFLFPKGISYGSVEMGNLIGKWKLLYKGNYGYEFRFYKNYRAMCILYLRSNALVFMGIYTVEEGSRIRINIYKMKKECNSAKIFQKSGFMKTASSYFIFNGQIKKSKSGKLLILKPVSIVIDGRNSDGYFEPVIKMQKVR